MASNADEREAPGCRPEDPREMMKQSWLNDVLPLTACWLVVSSASAVDFENDIRPILRDRCVSCHGPLRQEGDLRLDAGKLILDGGTHAVVVPGQSAASELLRRVRSDDPDVRMPPEGNRISADQIRLLETWIDDGAEIPDEEAVAAPVERHWAFQPIRRPDVPVLNDVEQPVNPIDAFIFARRQSEGLLIPPRAAAEVLLRRVFLDLIGLPPTIAEQDQFSETQNLDQVIADLLQRPEYGERWARHWLDVARYADSNGYERDAEKPFVWRYRDYVIQALNDDKPFDRFVLEQIAGDELPDRSVESWIATGFLRLGHWDDEPADPRTDRYDQLDDIVSTTGQAFLGLTIGCARCHDHKFEPLTAADYYSMVAVFQPLVRPQDGRTERTIPIDGTDVYAWQETSGQPPETFLLKRGSVTNPGPRVFPAVPQILTKAQPEFPSAAVLNDHHHSEGATSRRRLTFARWLVALENPLTARVIVNRIWQQHFGEGLVTTANDFGLMGAPPTHPELLDWLAHWLMHDAGWSLKKLHTLILTSRSWQSVKTADSVIRYRRLEVEAIRDSMLAVSGQLNAQHFGPAMKPPIPQAAIEANTDKERIWQASDDREASRRSIYAFVKRGLIVPMFETLDLADTVSSCAKRQVTTVAPQALCLFNGRLTQQQAGHFAAMLRQQAGDDLREQILLAFRTALCRRPSESELARMQAFLKAESLEELCRVILNLNEFVYPE
ncbi:MAG: PSD1 and planctomycete cytochrome C domain-containing protein [Planctomycetaceae bacterium]